MTRRPISSSPISKRAFLKTAAATAVGVAAASSAAGADDKKRWDVIIVGAGTAGLPAAIFAGQRGGRVLLIEAAGQIGGSLFLSSAQMSAAGTKLQKSKNISDTPQSHFDDVMKISKGTANPDIVKLAVFNAAETFDWLTDNGLIVAKEHPVTGTTHEPYSAARYAWGKDGGISVLEILEKQIKPLIDKGALIPRSALRIPRCTRPAWLSSDSSSFLNCRAMPRGSASLPAGSSFQREEWQIEK